MKYKARLISCILGLNFLNELAKAGLKPLSPLWEICIFHPPQNNQIHISTIHNLFNAYDSMRNEKVSHVR